MALDDITVLASDRGTIKLFVDDERIPVSSGWTIVRTYDDFITIWDHYGAAIEALSMDHDLGLDSLDAKDCINWLVEHAQDHRSAVTGLREVIFHSANVEGVKNMRGLLENAIVHEIIPDMMLTDYSCLFYSDHAIMPKDMKRTDL
jgi:hypothetical protein